MVEDLERRTNAIAAARDAVKEALEQVSPDNAEECELESYFFFSSDFMPLFLQFTNIVVFSVYKKRLSYATII